MHIPTCCGQFAVNGQFCFCCRGHNYPIWCVDVSTLGVYVATGSHDRTARLWSLDRTFPLRIFAGHNQDVEVYFVHHPLYAHLGQYLTQTGFTCH
jgi:WD40 repeat protein